MKKILSIYLTGIVIKLIDDYMDQEFDELISEINLARVLGKGTMLYAILIFCFATILNQGSAVTLFLASYIIGMAANFHDKMPSNLFGYQESIILISLSWIIFGSAEFFSSIFLIIAIQCIDDYLDYNKDKYSTKNWAFILGKTETLLLSIIFFISSMYLDFLKAISVICSMLIIVNIIKYWLPCLMEIPERRHFKT